MNAWPTAGSEADALEAVAKFRIGSRDHFRVADHMRVGDRGHIGAASPAGPARVLDPEPVRAFAAELDAMDVETLRARFDPDAMAAARIYPDTWVGGVAEFTGLAVHFAALRRFYQAAAEKGEAVLLALT